MEDILNKVIIISKKENFGNCLYTIWAVIPNSDYCDGTILDSEKLPNYNACSVVGRAYIKESQYPYVDDILVRKALRRIGIATKIYKYIENVLKIKLNPAPNQSDAGKQFWKRLKFREFMEQGTQSSISGMGAGGRAGQSQATPETNVGKINKQKVVPSPFNPSSILKGTTPIPAGKMAGGVQGISQPVPFKPYKPPNPKTVMSSLA